jgi:CubicO group peptidase (beta-lactamase class C family)
MHEAAQPILLTQIRGCSGLSGGRAMSSRAAVALLSLLSAGGCSGTAPPAVHLTGQAPSAAEESQGVRTPAEHRAREYLDLVNSATRSQAAAYVHERFSPNLLDLANVDQWVLAIGFDRYSLGQTDVVRFEVDGATGGEIIFESELQGRLQSITIEVEPESPHRITRIAGPEPIPMRRVTPSEDGARGALLDSFVRRLAYARSFSGVVVLARGDTPIFKSAYGRAEWRFGVRNTIDTRFYLGSITKAFTAVAVAQLVEQDKISWDDPLSRFLPDFPTPEAASRIQIKHLLSHTSGLGNVYPSGTEIVPNRYRSVGDFLATAPRTPLISEPGTSWRYSNLGYLLLGRIVEIASGEDFYDYLSRHIFGPAGMMTAGTDSYDTGVRDLAYGYEPNYSLDQLEFELAMLKNPARAAPFGGAYATADDLLRFGRALQTGVLIRQATWALISTAKPELGAPNWGYGFAVGGIQGVIGRNFVGHGGNARGACTSWGTIEDAAVPYTFVVLSNSGSDACIPVLNYLFDLIPATPH